MSFHLQSTNVISLDCAGSSEQWNEPSESSVSYFWYRCYRPMTIMTGVDHSQKYTTTHHRRLDCVFEKYETGLKKLPFLKKKVFYSILVCCGTNNLVAVTQPNPIGRLRSVQSSGPFCPRLSLP